MNEHELQTSKNLLCGTCGESLTERDGELICETCEHFFETSGVISECLDCHTKFAHFPAIDEPVFITLHSRSPVLSFQDQKLWKDICPECRNKWWEWRHVSTTKEIIKDKIKSASITIQNLEFSGIPREFIEYCIGKRKIH